MTRPTSRAASHPMRILAALTTAAIVVAACWIGGIDFERGVMTGIGFVAAWAAGICAYFVAGSGK